MTHLLAPVLLLLSPRRLPRGPRNLAVERRAESASTLRSPARRWLATIAVAAAAGVATPTDAQGEPAPVATATAASGESRAATEGSPSTPTNCESLPPFAGDNAALTAAGRELAARAKKFEIGSPRHTDVKIEVMSLFLSSGDLSMCKLLRTTRATRSLSPSQVDTIGCLERQFCRPMTLANACPAGMRNLGPEGCAPVQTCKAAGADGQVAACKAGDASCCAPALLMLEIADVQAGLPTPESLAVRRTLARLGCAAGHAEVCLEAAALGIGTLAAQRKRACALGHRESCSPPRASP